MENFTTEKIQEKAEALIDALKNMQLTKLKADFDSNLWGGYLQVMQRAWRKHVEKYGDLEIYSYVGCDTFEGMYLCEYLITFTSGVFYLVIYLHTGTLKFIRFDIGHRSTLN